MFTLKYGKLYEIEKKPYTYGSKRNKKILKRIECSLPELMTRNLKLGQELKNKITISSFMNDTETKTKKYLTQFLVSSRKRVKDIKTGLGLNNVIKKGYKNLDPICNHIDNDIYVKNSDFLLKEKNLISQKIAKEKHERINHLINNIKYIIKPTKLKRKSDSHRIVKSIPEEQMQKAKSVIKNELSNDENLLKRKINFYKQNLFTLAETKPKKFYKIASNIYFKSNLKMINYSKPSPASIQEQKIINLLKIRKHLMKSKEEKEKEKEKNEIEDEIYNNFNFEKKENVSDNKSDTIMVIKNLAKEKDNLENKTKKNMRRINSMIDINLPYFSNYHRTIKFCSKFNKNLSLITDITGNEGKKYKFKFKKNMGNKLDLIKNEIKNLTHEEIKKRCQDIEKKKNLYIFN